jgi:hypothetical protein
MLLRGINMSDKKIHYLDVNRAIERIVTPSVFDKIVNEVDASEIPTQYIESILVYYNNGQVIELSGSEITHPVPVNRRGNAEEMEAPYRQMREVKIFINTAKLEKRVNEMVEDLLGGYC